MAFDGMETSHRPTISIHLDSQHLLKLNGFLSALRHLPLLLLLALHLNMRSKFAIQKRLVCAHKKHVIPCSNRDPKVNLDKML
jgi:hypothetical protein